jgi:outer membrane protein OmpA-like peptidoglycan-associated protein
MHPLYPTVGLIFDSDARLPLGNWVPDKGIRMKNVNLYALFTAFIVPFAAPPALANNASQPSVSPSGETGLRSVYSADAPKTGLIRIAAGLEYFQDSSFLVDGDDASRLGGTLSLSYNPLDFLELWVNVAGRSTESAATTPQLIQSYGDLGLGFKVFYASQLPFSFGADFEAVFLPSSGSSGFNVDATSFRFGGLMTSDFQKLASPIPLRIHVNGTFFLDQSNKLVTQPIGASEEFALGISDHNRAGVGLGIEVPLGWVTPYLEYNLQIPLNYQRSSGDPSLAEVMPQWLTPAIRITPVRGLAIDVGAQIGLSPETTLGVPPVPKWNAFVMASYAIDPTGCAPEPVAELDPGNPAETSSTGPTGEVLALVTRAGDGESISGALVRTDRGPDYRTDIDGLFRTGPLAVGPLHLEVLHPGFETRTYTTRIEADKFTRFVLAVTPNAASTTLTASLMDINGRPISGAQVQLLGPSKIIGATDEFGEFRTQILPGEYKLTASVDGFQTRTRTLTIAKGEQMSLETVLKTGTSAKPLYSDLRIANGTVFLPKKLEFLRGRTTLSPESKAMLQSVAPSFAEQTKRHFFVIEGHTDNSGTESANLLLSKNRAQAVVDQLVEFNVPRNRLKSVGKGSSRPVASNLTREGREQNRRVEIYIAE